MTTRNLIESYGRRYTPFARLLAFIAVLLFGILLSFNSENANATVINTKVEPPAKFCKP